MRRGQVLTLFLVGLLLMIAPATSGDQDSMSLQAEIENTPEKGWFGIGETVEISATLINTGEANSITVDPSCNEVLRVWSVTEIVADYSRNCMGQSRGLDVDGFSETILNTLSWDLTGDNGEIVPSGEYRVEYLIPGNDLSSEVTVLVQTPLAIPDYFSIDVLVTARDGVHIESVPSVLTIRLQNNLPQDVSFDFGDCKVIINSNLYGDCGPKNLLGNQVVTISQTAIIPFEGDNTYSVSLGDSNLSEEISFYAISDTDNGMSNGEIGNLDVRLSTDYRQNSGMEYFESAIVLENKNNENVTLSFNDTCRSEMWILDSTGTVVMDSRYFKECSSMNTETLLSPSGEKSFAQPDWQFIDVDACYVPPGDLMVIMEIPEHDLFGTDIISITRDKDFYCENTDIEVTAEISGNQILNLEPIITATDYFDIKWFNICGLESKLYGPDGYIEEYLTECDYTDTTTTRIQQDYLDSFEIDMTSMEDGEYFIEFETNTAPQIKSTITFQWPIVEEGQNEIPDESTQTENKLIEVFEGFWSATSNEDGKCWLLNTEDSQIITLSGAPGLANWMPVDGVSGVYSAYESAPTPACNLFSAPSITITGVVSEDSPILEDPIVIEKSSDSQTPNSNQDISPEVISVGVAIASGGILSLLFTLISTNESLRIPATTAGLWFLGLIGRTSETSDGRYQRGRLMGYLTANPGCHFRALMAALDMSNGQITHHLKILQDEDRIWRRPDGRLVRFYPYTIDLHPGISDDDLPLPPLSPDPNSLQGKILRLLDDDGQMNKSPTQAELAQRLDRSQQLVSHHLRTLQKFGLVERLKKGMKNRYCLTREAVFLLDTTDL